MRLKEFALLLGLGTLGVFGAPTHESEFVRLCMSKNPPADFIMLVNSNFNDPADFKIKLGDFKSCQQADKLSQEKKIVFLQRPLQKATSLSLFPKVKSLDLHTEQVLQSLPLFNMASLERISIQAKLRDFQVSSLSVASNLTTLSLAGMDEASSIDFTDIGQMKALVDVNLYGLWVQKSKSLEQVKQLESFGMKKVKLDESIDWSAFKQLKLKKIQRD